MLAHSGLALITAKLQNQRLEDSSTTTCCSTLPVLQDTSTKTTCQQQSSLTVKGKNVWTISLESERQGRYEFGSQDGDSPASRPPEKVQVSYMGVCRHKKPRQSCRICETAPNTPMAPPKKKHCRSLSVPPDCLTIFPAPILEPVAKIWKPIAVIPQSDNIDNPSKERNLLPISSTGDSAKWSRLSSSIKLVPVVPPPPSVDSGHYTSDLQTPPGSPVPRPASAASDTSFSSLGSAWYDYSPMRSRIRVLENRSLSCEDRISESSSTISMPCVHDSMEPSPGCCGSTSQDGSSMCGSIPRCHSQPCVLHHRRCGKKRRRDCDRPTLNFIKMTETAYPRSHWRSEPRNTPVNDQQHHLPMHQMFTDSIGFGLNPIASSPLDSELPVVARHLMDLDLTSAASTALPPTPPDNTSPNFLPQISCKSQQEEEEDDEEEEDCNCHDSLTDDTVGFFPVNDLDLEQIESH